MTWTAVALALVFFALGWIGLALCDLAAQLNRIEHLLRNRGDKRA